MSGPNEQQTSEPLEIYSVLLMMIDQVSSIAWQKMGLQPDPMTGGIHKDLSQARVAIDVVAQVSAHVEGMLEEQDRRQLQNLIRDLRINFAEKTRTEGQQ